MINNISLSNGQSIPLLGLGATGIYGEKDNEKVSKTIIKQYDMYRYAFSSGKCHLFDTSGGYGHNEEVLGQAFMDSGIPRKDICIISKISNRQQEECNVRKAFEHSLKMLGTDYLDAYLIHWPEPDTFLATWVEMESLYKDGLVKSIGVCNCDIHHLEYLMKKSSIAPMINQFEIHPLFTQTALVNYCYAFDIQPIAYTPIGRMHDCLIKAKPIRELCSKYGRTPTQIILRWHYQLGNIAIPRTLSFEHFEDFFAIDEFELSSKEICWINSLNDNIRLRYNPDTADFSNL